MKSGLTFLLGVCLLQAGIAASQPQSAPDTLWTRLYDYYPDYQVPPEGYALCETADGGFLVATGITVNPFWYSVLALRLDANGDTLWTRVYDYGLPTFVKQLPDGGFLICGGGSWDIMFSGRAFLFRIDANGDTVRTRRFENAYSIASFLTETGNDMYVGGNDTTRGEAFWLAKLDQNWDAVWSRSYRRWNDWCVAMGRGRDGGFVLAGNYRLFNPGAGRLRMVFADSSGNLRADSLYGSSDTFGLSATFAENGGCVMSAGTATHGFGAYKVDGFARSEWHQGYDMGGLRGGSYAVAATINNGWILAGYVYSGDTLHGEDLTALARIDSNGELLWSGTYGRGHGLAVISTRDGGFLVAGPWGGGYALTIVRTRPEGEGLEERPQSVPVEFALASYPNPFNSSTVITFNLLRTSPVQLSILNLLGQRMALLCDERLAAGRHQITWNAANVSSGVYFAQLVAGSAHQTRKVMLLR